MKKKIKKEKELFVCERCGNPVSPYAIKCKWCKKTLKPEYFEQKENIPKNKDGNK